MISRGGGGGDSENFGTVLKFSRYVSPFHDMYSITVLPCIRIELLAMASWAESRTSRGNQERHALFVLLYLHKKFYL
jgi:hypothetical protein